MVSALISGRPSCNAVRSQEPRTRVSDITASYSKIQHWSTLENKVGSQLIGAQQIQREKYTGCQVNTSSQSDGGLMEGRETDRVKTRIAAGMLAWLR